MKELPRRILAGVALGGGALHEAEPTAQDRRIVHQAFSFARLTGAELRLLHIGEWEVPAADQSHHDAILAERRKKLEALAAEIQAAANAQSVSTSVALAAGKPYLCFMEEAERYSADLFVIGPVVHRHGILTRVIHGSTAGRLIRQSPLPVLRVAGTAPDHFERMLVAVDLLPEMSGRLVATANALHGRDAAMRRYLLHCMEFPQDIVMRRMPDAAKALREYHAEVESRAREGISGLLGDEEARWRVLLERDWVGRVAPRVVQEEVIDLLVIAGVTLPRLAGLLLGTTAEKILEAAAVSALILKPEQ